MSKLLQTLFLVLAVGFIVGIGYVSIADVPVSQETVKTTMTYEDFKAKNNP